MERTELTDLRGKADAGEAVLRTVILFGSIEPGAKAVIKAEILRYAYGLRQSNSDNPLSIAQAEAMRDYAEQFFD